jgi:hypothetical protein
MFAFAYVVHFFANEFTRLRAGCLALPLVLAGTFQRFFFWHKSAFCRFIGAPQLWRWPSIRVSAPSNHSERSSTGHLINPNATVLANAEHETSEYREKPSMGLNPYDRAA